ncbi:hypothetical protein WICPIJ_009580 [Wickerhamomyces pijperi]|uniref:SCP2 domain-containing protein n=1 Tax=Wickerhamomyces pijperi TaxID=599730 RepID=A0A9P8TDH7_WICPI|nr:hypothetical protein WICPIJ_009580 [Wickerhamomyces pijperi]
MSTFKSDATFDQIAKVLSTDKQLAKKLAKQTQSVILFHIKSKKSSQPKHWKLDLKSDSPSLISAKDNDSSSVDLEISVSDLDFKKLVDGKANAQKLFLGGKLKVKGDVSKAGAIEKVLSSVRPVKAKL